MASQFVLITEMISATVGSELSSEPCVLKSDAQPLGLSECAKVKEIMDIIEVSYLKQIM